MPLWVIPIREKEGEVIDTERGNWYKYGDKNWGHKATNQGTLGQPPEARRDKEWILR